MLPRTIAALGLLAGLGLAPLPAADAPKGEAREFVSKDGKYRTKFPGEPKSTETTAGGMTIHTTMLAPRSGEALTVVYFDLLVEIPAGQAKEMLKKFGAGIKGKVESEKDVSLGKDKLPGREVVYSLDKAVIRQLMVLDGKRVYQVLVGGPTRESVTSKEADAFVGSFEVTK
ncbi:MAG: hypothetical protein JWO38_546 [Gemmataceae bacterium]|nr:hypothetical protein [Gemmataceae bacterium]